MCVTESEGDRIRRGDFHCIRFCEIGVASRTINPSPERGFEKWPLPIRHLKMDSKEPRGYFAGGGSRTLTPLLERQILPPEGHESSSIRLKGECSIPLPIQFLIILIS